MAFLYKTFFITSCISLCVQAMEQTNSLSMPEKENHQRYLQINDLYKAAYKTLDYYNSTDTQSIAALSGIITKTKELKQYNIEEKQIGEFAYKQEESIKNKLLAYAKPPYNGPLYVSVFIEKIARYNTLLKKNEFTSPTLEQFLQHTHNQKIKAAVNKAVDCKLFLDLDKINSEKKILFSIPISFATHEFENLLNDITQLREISPEDIKIIADILYGPALKKDQ